MQILLPDIDVYIQKYINNEVQNPLLKKVILEEITFSNNLNNIFHSYLSNVALSGDINKLNILIELINKLPELNKKYIYSIIINSFIKLSIEEQLFLIMNVTEFNKQFFCLLNNNEQNTDINTILINVGMAITKLSIININEYLIKYIQACELINDKYGLYFMEKYIENNIIEIIEDNKLLSYFISRYNDTEFGHFKRSNINNFLSHIRIKLESIKLNIDSLSINNMDMVFEIYKLGILIIDSNILYNNVKSMLPPMIDTIKINFTNDQLQYIAQSIHTCLINKNTVQAHRILAIIYYLNNTQTVKFMEYYNYWLTIRIMKKDHNEIINEENEIWEFKNVNITTDTIFDNYNRLINNIKYSIDINNHLQLVKVNKLHMNKTNVTLTNKVNTNNNLENFKHHINIQKYIDGLDKYIDKRTVLQKIVHDNMESKITFNTSYGNITCSLYMGSILLHLNDGDKSFDELKLVLNVNTKIIEDKLLQYVQILVINNLIIYYVKNGITYYKYVEPYGMVIVNNELLNSLSKNVASIKISNFTDIIMTLDSRIMKETKLANQINKLELERKIQEFLGDDYIRNMYYQRIESLKSRFFIEEDNNMIIYI